MAKRKVSDDISARPSKIIRQESQKLDESNLQTKALKNVALAVYRERRRELPVLPKSRIEAHEALKSINLNTNKDESFMMVNYQENGIIVFTCNSNLTCLCNDISDIFVDGTFKYCTKFFHQLYTIHGSKNGHYVPLVFARLPTKTELCYRDLWTKIQHVCTARDLHLNPSSVRADFEPAMHNVIVALFPDARIDYCSFHLGQAWWRNIQRIGLSSEYKDKSGEIGKWLSKFLVCLFCFQKKSLMLLWKTLWLIPLTMRNAMNLQIMFLTTTSKKLQDSLRNCGLVCLQCFASVQTMDQSRSTRISTRSSMPPTHLCILSSMCY